MILIIKKENREIYKKYFYNNINVRYNTDTIALNNTQYFNFLQDIKNTNIEFIIDYFKSKEMNFAFILYFINYFYPIRHITIESLSMYTQYDPKRIESIINDYEYKMWNSYEYNNTLNKIKIFK